MSQQDDLNQALSEIDAKVTASEGVQQSAMTLLKELHDALGTVTSAPDLTSAVAAAQAIRDKISTDSDVLAQAVAANPHP